MIRFFACAFLLAAPLACAGPLGPDGGDAAPDVRWADLGRPCPADAPALSLSEAIRATLPPDEENVNGRWASVARRVPGGWGGFWYEEGRPTMSLVEPDRLEAAIAGLRAEGMYTTSSVDVAQGRWDFAQLYDWYRYMDRVIGHIAGRSFSDIQESNNRLEFGAISEEVRVAIEEALAAAEIPCFLVAIELRDYAVAAGR